MVLKRAVLSVFLVAATSIAALAFFGFAGSGDPVDKLIVAASSWNLAEVNSLLDEGL